MCVYIYVCMNECINVGAVCMYVFMYVWTNLWVYMLYDCKSVWTNVWVYVLVCIFIHTHAYNVHIPNIRTRMRMQAWARTHALTHTHTYKLLHKCTFTYTNRNQYTLHFTQAHIRNALQYADMYAHNMHTQGYIYSHFTQAQTRFHVDQTLWQTY